jgi:hypothetical protein
MRFGQWTASGSSAVPLWEGLIGGVSQRLLLDAPAPMVDVKLDEDRG